MVARGLPHHRGEEHAADRDYASKWGDVIVVGGEIQLSLSKPGPVWRLAGIEETLEPLGHREVTDHWRQLQLAWAPALSERIQVQNELGLEVLATCRDGEPK